MLSAFLRASDLSEHWLAQPEGWVAGKSFLRPFANPALHAGGFFSATRTLLVVRERIRGVPAAGAPELAPVSEEEWDAALRAARAWPLDFIALAIVRSEGTAEVRLHTGHWGTAPVYLLAREKVLRVEWDATRLYPHLSSLRVDPSAAAEYVVNLDYPNSRRTLFPEISRLTERATAVWRAPHRRVSVQYPAPALVAQSGRLVRGADVCGAFREILTASMRRWHGTEDGCAAVELSGGLDSTLVAATAASISRQRVRSLGLIQPGPPGRYQEVRRASIIRHLGLIDRTLHCIDFPPFAPESRRLREGLTAPWDEFYYEAASALHDIGMAAGATTILSGMGGDELATLEYDDLAYDPPVDKADDEPLPERVLPPFATAALRAAYHGRQRRVDCAPGPWLHCSTIESAGAVSPMCLRAGLWPVHPLCTPELVEFCRRLPFAWRCNRRIHREVLASFGLPKLVTHPKRATLEHFSDVMEFAIHSASRESIERMFEESRLAQQGLVDAGRLVKSYRAHCAARANSEWLLGVIVLELTLRAVEHQRASNGSHARV